MDRMGGNGDVVHQYIAAYETGDQKQINCFLHPAHVYHPPGGGRAVSLEERIADEAFFFSAFADIKVTVENPIVEADKAACHVRMECTHTGDYQGIPRSDKRITITYMEILRLKEGMIVEEWTEFDFLSILNQIKQSN